MSHIRHTATRWACALACAGACAAGERPVHIEHAGATVGILSAPAVVYFTVRDEGTRPDTVTAIAVDAAQATLMETPQPHRLPQGGAGSAAMMMPVTRVPLSSRGRVRFAPGGYTGMLYNLRRPLSPGDSVHLTVTLASGRRAFASVPVVAYPDLERTLSPDDLAHASRAAVTPTVAAGEQLYRSNGCASCHGPDGHGDGPVGRSLIPPPRDFRVAAAFKAGTDMESIALTLAIGVPAGGSMPLYAHLTNDERRALARFLISLRTTSP